MQLFTEHRRTSALCFSSMDTEDDSERPQIEPQIEPPPPDLQSIIDKMAMYVAKNGPEFEIVVKSKKDKRFDFLHSWHKHFPYYHHKKTLHLQVGLCVLV